MKAWICVLLLGGLTWGLGAQTPAPAAVPTPTVSAPALPDEKTLTIRDTGTATNANGPTSGASGDVTVWDFIKMFLILALVIGMIVGFLWFLRRLSGPSQQPDSPIKVLYTQTIAGNRSLVVVEIGAEILLLGAAESGLSLIKEITDSETADSLRLAAARETARAGARNFSRLLGQFLGQRERLFPKVEEPVENSSDFLKKQRERLKKL